ncbi:MAG: hypothetical protein ACKVVP_21740, partial [Chloroflexota bacterium]
MQVSPFMDAATTPLEGRTSEGTTGHASQSGGEDAFATLLAAATLPRALPSSAAGLEDLSGIFLPNDETSTPTDGLATSHPQQEASAMQLLGGLLVPAQSPLPEVPTSTGSANTDTSVDTSAPSKSLGAWASNVVSAIVSTMVPGRADGRLATQTPSEATGSPLPIGSLASEPGADDSAVATVGVLAGGNRASIPLDSLGSEPAPAIDEPSSHIILTPVPTKESMQINPPAPGRARTELSSSSISAETTGPITNMGTTTQVESESEVITIPRVVVFSREPGDSAHREPAEISSTIQDDGNSMVNLNRTN